MGLDLVELATGIARLEERIEALSDRQEAAEARNPEVIRAAVREAVFEAIEKRVAPLEADNAKLKGMLWAAGLVIPALAWVAEHALPKLVPLLPLFILWGCAAGELSGPHYPEHLRPVTVLVDSNMPPDCLASTTRAVDFWADNGVQYLELALIANPPVGPLAGTIIVSSDELEDPMAGVTFRATLVGQTDELLGAHVFLDPDFCGVKWTVAEHELGHALGLDHVDDPANLMFPVQLGQTEATDAQRDVVL